MGTAEERMRILKMLEEGTITAEEATKLLQALTTGARSAARAGSGRDPRWLRVRVTDTDSGQVKVSLNLPMGLVRTGIKLGARFVPNDAEVNYDDIMYAIESGETGKLAEFIDNEQSEKVEIWAE
ncbi:MAG: hypothetical protein JW910_01545 [Anaerolineae bacterium]|nr:hypothetical protein [Anaerolineae bacterium]